MLPGAVLRAGAGAIDQRRAEAMTCPGSEVPLGKFLAWATWSSATPRLKKGNLLAAIGGNPILSRRPRFKQDAALDQAVKVGTLRTRGPS